MINITFTNGQILNIVWDPKEICPAKIYVFICEKNRPKKSFHWILDPDHHKLLTLTFPLHGNLRGHDIIVSGLMPMSRGKMISTHYEICGSAAESVGDLSHHPEITAHLVKGSLKQKDAMVQGGDFELKKFHKPPSDYKLVDLPVKNKCIHLIWVHQELPAADFLYVHQASSGSSFKFPNRLKPASDYHVTVYESDARVDDSAHNGIHCYDTVKISKVLRFRAYMTKTEVNELFVKSSDFVRRHGLSGDLEITHMYRDKMPDYFDFVFHNNGGIIPCYYKTLSGDKASSLHFNIKGIFFHTFVDLTTLQPPTISYQGSMRLHIAAELFFDDVNIYFADFYCHYKSHKVTLVFACKGSQGDKFCQPRLQKLDPYDNPFLYRTSEGRIFVNSGVRVEVIYTAPIYARNILKTFGPFYIFFTHVQAVGKPGNIVISKPKNANCNVCNLDVRKNI
ncbi:hypothetical protein ACJMK2_028059 [Sinanodonta woodiana]|uniref:Phytanoyl-CoA hydroxylase-interacting protein-like C-terminal domain-containing protein n=1 Tax=Sinanodonta woodiana TaxID=1069815 RepID=A0ABD3X5X8_SINWO